MTPINHRPTSLLTLIKASSLLAPLDKGWTSWTGWVGRHGGRCFRGQGSHQDLPHRRRRGAGAGGVDLELYAGELVVMLGPSGSGKSTLLNILGGLDTPARGTVRFRGHDLAALGERELTLYRRDTSASSSSSTI